MKRLVAILISLSLLFGVLSVNVTVAAGENSTERGTTMVVVGGWLRLRSAPNFTSATIASYYTGTVVNCINKTSDGWCEVSLSDGKHGYMYGKYLTSGGVVPPLPPVNIPATVTSMNGYGVKLRSGPSTAYGVLKVCPVGTVVTILAQGTYWDYIRVGSMTGYMMSQFLSTGSPTPQPGYLATVISQNGYGVRMRTGPGYGYGIIGVYAVGTVVTVLQHNATWDYIRIGSRTGYMMNSFLTTGGIQTNVTGVVLNNTSPSTGDVLSATVLPNGATVSYQWMDANGIVLGTEATYTVKAADTGKKIRLTVTGIGYYTGTAMSSLTNPVQERKTLTAISISSYSPVAGDTLSVLIDPPSATADYIWYRNDGAKLGTGKTYTVKDADIGMCIAVRAIGNGVYSGDIFTAYTNPVLSCYSTPAPTVTPSVTPTTEPSITPLPTEEPTATELPESTETSVPTEAPVSTPDAAETMEPAATPETGVGTDTDLL